MKKEIILNILLILGVAFISMALIKISVIYGLIGGICIGTYNAILCQWNG